MLWASLMLIINYDCHALFFPLWALCYLLSFVNVLAVEVSLTKCVFHIYTLIGKPISC